MCETANQITAERNVDPEVLLLYHRYATTVYRYRYLVPVTNRDVYEYS